MDNHVDGFIYIQKLWFYSVNLQLFPKVSWRNCARKAKYFWEASGRNVTVWCGIICSTTSGKRKQKSKQAKFCCRVTKHKWPTRKGASSSWHIHNLNIGHIRYALGTLQCYAASRIQAAHFKLAPNTWQLCGDQGLFVCSLKGPSQPHLWICLQSRTRLLHTLIYCLWSVSKRRKSLWNY